MFLICVAEAAAITPAPVPAAGARTLYQQLSVSGVFSDFLKACDLSGESEALKKPGSLTVFAPTDAAFGRLPQDERKTLLASKAKAAQLVKNHILDGQQSLEQVRAANTLKMRSGTEFPVDNKRGLKLGQAPIQRGDIASSNGFLHVLAALVD